MTHIKFDYSIFKRSSDSGWVDLPENYDREEFSRIQQSADKIRSDSDVLVVIGIGGSYLGAKAAVEMLTPTFGQDGPEIVFAGHQLSSQSSASPARRPNLR